MVAGVGGVTAMEDGSNHAFTVVDGDPCPLTEQVHLGALGLEVSQGASEGTSVICVAQAAGVEFILLGWCEALLPVAPSSSFQPSVEGFDINNEEEGGEGVPLDGAPSYGDRGSTLAPT